MRAAAVPVLLLAAAAGCFDCGMMGYDELTWKDPVLYAKMEREGPLAATWNPGSGALPWNGTWEGVRQWPGARLSVVAMAVPPSPGSEGERRGIFTDIRPPNVEEVGVERDGFLFARVDGEPPEAELRQAFDRLLANVTGGLDAEATWSGFLASKLDSGMRHGIPLHDEGQEFEERIVWTYAADARANLRLDALADRASLQPPNVGFGGGGMSSDAGWSFSFTLPTFTVRDGPDTLEVDSAGHVRVTGTHDSEEDLREAATRLTGLVGHTPDLSAAEASGSIC